VFQSTPLREGRLLKYGNDSGWKIVSIHAPARGATHPSCLWARNTCVSIHAPARGATWESDGVFQQVHVSIHAPARGATWESDGVFQQVHVSIHAPARGATMIHPLMYMYVLSFNPRPCARGDRPDQRTMYLPDQFQSTPLREGRRQQRGIQSKSLSVSIHAPARGATLSYFMNCFR